MILDRNDFSACLTTKDLTTRWGVSDQYIYNLVATEQLPCLRFKRLFFFRPADIVAYEEASEELRAQENVRA